MYPRGVPTRTHATRKHPALAHHNPTTHPARLRRGAARDDVEQVLVRQAAGALHAPRPPLLFGAKAPREHVALALQSLAALHESRDVARAHVANGRSRGPNAATDAHGCIDTTVDAIAQGCVRNICVPEPVRALCLLPIHFILRRLLLHQGFFIFWSAASHLFTVSSETRRGGDKRKNE